MDAADSNPEAWQVAYCAPGHRFDAAVVLMLKGEMVCEIREHPFLEGTANIMLVNPDAITFGAAGEFPVSTEASWAAFRAGPAGG